MALGIAFSIVKSVMPAMGIGSHKPAHSAQPTASPPAMADLGGVQVPGTGQPLLMLNPGLVRPGTTVQVMGSGFDAGSVVDIKMGGVAPVRSVKADRWGGVNTSLSFPSGASSAGGMRIVAQQRNSTKAATAQATVAQGVGTATLSAMVGKPGDTVALTARGFEPGEQLALYWGRTTGQPSMTMQADSSGAVSHAPLRVGVAPVGTSSLFVVGRKSGIAAGVPFQVLNLYPSIGVKPYALKSQQPISFTGKGFAPGERVLVYLNRMGGQPVMAIPTSDNGTFSTAGFKVPYALKGQQSMVFVGEQSRAIAKSGFTVLPYMPSARPSTYGGMPGTMLSFYAQGFAPNEAVHVYVRTRHDGDATLVSAFRVDATGRAAAVGGYTIPGDADGLYFSLVGMRSGATASSTIKVDHSGGPVNVPAAPPYHLPKDLEK